MIFKWVLFDDFHSMLLSSLSTFAYSYLEKHCLNEFKLMKEFLQKSRKLFGHTQASICSNDYIVQKGNLLFQIFEIWTKLISMILFVQTKW